MPGFAGTCRIADGSPARAPVIQSARRVWHAEANMCGIAGLATIERPSPRELVVRMRDTLRHRGPDDEGAWWSDDGRIALGHRRLSIIDLSSAGRQPMTDGAGELQIVFNGEIYNYQDLREELATRGHHFRTRTDTEVILEAYREWDVQCLARLNGMFAFALYDPRRSRLLLARDRAGEKPLFYRVNRGTLAFASELKALFADPDCPRALDLEALDYYLAFGYVPGRRCLVQGIEKLQQGCALTFDTHTGAVDTFQYWRLPASPGRPTDSDTDESLADELERLLTDSVRMRMIADVPVGIMLSGGIDSSLVVAAAARSSPARIKTFTISFPGSNACDEAPYARTVAQHFGTEHIELPAEPATVELLPQLALQYDEPIGDPSMVPTYLVSRLIRREATVALGGDGGDELFGGYPHHSWVLQQARLARFIPGPARRSAAAAFSLLPPGVRGRNYLMGLGAQPPRNIVQFNVLFDAAARRRLLGRFDGRRAPDGRPENYKAALCNNGDSALRQATALDFRTYLVDDILVKVDRASMLCSLEVRAPWLDPRLIDFAFGRVPDRLRASATERKILPRRVARRLLPSTLDLTRKQGFSLPLQEWFKGDWGTYIEEVLTDPGADLFDKKMVWQLLKRQRGGFLNTNRLYALAFLELWRRSYQIGAG